MSVMECPVCHKRNLVNKVMCQFCAADLNASATDYVIAIDVPLLNQLKAIGKFVAAISLLWFGYIIKLLPVLLLLLLIDWLGKGGAAAIFGIFLLIGSFVLPWLIKFVLLVALIWLVKRIWNVV